MKIDNKVECNDDENEDECDQITFVLLRDLRKPSMVGKKAKPVKLLKLRAML